MLPRRAAQPEVATARLASGASGPEPTFATRLLPDGTEDQNKAPGAFGFLQRLRGLSPVGETGFEPATPWSRRTKCGHPPLRTPSPRLASARNFRRRGHRRVPPCGRSSTACHSAYGAGTAAIRAARRAADRRRSRRSPPRLQGHRLPDGEGRRASRGAHAQRCSHPEVRVGRVRDPGFVSRGSTNPHARNGRWPEEECAGRRRRRVRRESGFGQRSSTRSRDPRHRVVGHQPQRPFW